MRSASLSKPARYLQATLMERNKQRCGFASVRDVSTGAPSSVLLCLGVCLWILERSHPQGISATEPNPQESLGCFSVTALIP